MTSWNDDAVLRVLESVRAALGARNDESALQAASRVRREAEEPSREVIARELHARGFRDVARRVLSDPGESHKRRELAIAHLRDMDWRHGVAYAQRAFEVTGAMLTWLTERAAHAEWGHGSKPNLEIVCASLHKTRVLAIYEMMQTSEERIALKALFPAHFQEGPTLQAGTK